jgi:hypothetical protein
MERTILSTIKDWKTEMNRKVLLLRGARQVGKTYIVRELAKDFTHFVEVNFEKNSDVKHFLTRILTRSEFVPTCRLITEFLFWMAKRCSFLMKFKVAQKQFNHSGFFMSRNQDCMLSQPVRCSSLLWKI